MIGISSLTRYQYMFAQVYWGAAPPSVLCVRMRSELGQACAYAPCGAMIAHERVVTRRALTERRLLGVAPMYSPT